MTESAKENARTTHSEFDNALSAVLDERGREPVCEYLLLRFAVSKADADVPQAILPTTIQGLAAFDIGFGQNIDSQTLGDAVESVVGSRGNRGETGAHYTPEYIVEYINDETVDVQLRDALTQHPQADGGDLTEIATSVPEENRERAIESIDDVHVLDPAMGSGHFLIDALERIADVRQSVHPDTKLWKHRKRTAERNVYGVDINPLAVDITQLRIRLSILEKVPTGANGVPKAGVGVFG